MIKKTLLFLLLTILIGGCAGMVEHRLSKEFALSQPESVAILPVHGEGPERAKRILREMTARNIKDKNYRIKPLDETDRILKTLDPQKKIKAQEVVELLGTDSILLVNITEWDESLVTPYGALSIEVTFTLYGKEGTILWSAESREKQNGIKLDKELLKMGVIEVYEPMLERLTEAALFTLPDRKPEERPEKRKKKRFFDWL